MGLISREGALRTRSGAYRRRYDRTAIADVPWLVAFIGGAALGAESSLAWAGMMCCATWAAMADARFRIVPVPCAAAMALLAVACNGADAPRAVVLLAVSAAALGLLSALAKAIGSAFGAGDVAITACCLTALGGPHRWAPFAGTLLILMIIALIASASGNRAAGRGDAGLTLVPFGCFAAPALACALVATL